MRSPNQEFVSPKNWFKLEYPRMWEMEVVENIPTFFDPLHGKGALQVFSVKLGSAEQLQEQTFLKEDTLEGKMVSFLTGQDVDADPDKIITYEKENTFFIPYEYENSGRFFMVCMFQKQLMFVLALYNCEGVPTNEEAKVIADVIQSVTLL